MAVRKEGDWFAVRLSADAYAVGIVARAGRASTVFGYFFGPFPGPTPAEVPCTLAPSDAVLLARFLDEALRSERWPILASSVDWERANWPMPEFHVLDSRALTGASFARRFSEDNPARIVGRRQITAEDEARYPADYGACQPELVEHLLGQIFGIVSAAEEDDDNEAFVTDEGVRHVLLIPSAAVESVRQQLQTSGFTSVEVLDEREGLVDVEVFQRGRMHALQSTIADIEAQLTAIARTAGGEYDGAEWALPDS